MNLSELAQAIATKTGSSQADVKITIAAVFDQIADAAARGEEVSINGFGKFSVKDRPERQGRNPSTGEAMTIAASKKVSFTAAKGLKDKL
ncbi:transcriptional regulator HU subunit alpha [Croceibacterium mercuriale]|uniref:Transcriptional regulator HU subunit alpha n=1 Tax=Croceibacterium mercuriale TaxID=1572751 RepID=A0A0B2BWS4_9SPHN|nr:HU family DNA-binding protein [Croceibacterium mercuriale]KHL24275.1 transcriptional regulator HU subunit alpha [Croceibacterium mercuriale]